MNEGFLHRFSVSRVERDAMILFARIKAGWSTAASLIGAFCTAP